MWRPIRKYVNQPYISHHCFYKDDTTSEYEGFAPIRKYWSLTLSPSLVSSCLHSQHCLPLLQRSLQGVLVRSLSGCTWSWRCWWLGARLPPVASRYMAVVASSSTRPCHGAGELRRGQQQGDTLWLGRWPSQNWTLSLRSRAFLYPHSGANWSKRIIPSHALLFQLLCYTFINV